MDDAGAALAGVAADMRAGQAEVLAQILDQQRARIDVRRRGLAVHIMETLSISLSQNRVVPGGILPPQTAVESPSLTAVANSVKN